MALKNPEVDAYMKKAAPFARPILKRIRRLFHQACPEIQEVMKWSFPCFEYQGIVGNMAAFKKHCSLGFWKASLLSDPQGILKESGDQGICSIKVTSVDELPDDDVLLAYISEAVALNQAGKKISRPKKKLVSKLLEVPEDLQRALRKNKVAQKTFEQFSNSHRKEYVEWITEAKQEATRLRRLETTIQQLAEGKSRHWKYQK